MKLCSVILAREAEEAFRMDNSRKVYDLVKLFAGKKRIDASIGL